MNNNMTLEEKERYAYIQGDFRGAELYGQMMDAQKEIQELEDKVDPYALCPNCGEFL